jgi:hypothetical protein
MTRAKDRREELEALVRQKIGGAYRYGLVSMSMQASSPLGYPEENADTDAILAAVDAYAKAAARREARGTS